jgi:hypothetical protein
VSQISTAFVFRKAAVGGMFVCALTTSALAESDSWQQLAPLPTPRRLLAAAEHHGKIYTFGGCGSPCFAPPLHTSTFEERRVEVYSPETGSWSPRDAMPSIVFGAAAVAPGDGFIYLFGGFLTAGSTQAYDPQHDTWETRPRMPTPRHAAAVVAVEGKVYVIGGSNGTTALAAFEAYDAASRSWEPPLPPMPTARAFLAAAAVGHKIYAIGGAPDCCGHDTTNVVEVYDIDRRQWSSGPSLGTGLQTSAAAALGGKVYVLGGFIPGHGAQASTLRFDPANPTAGWTTQTPIPEPRDQAPAVALLDGIHVLGGATSCHCSARREHHRFQVIVPVELIDAGVD